MIHLLLVASLTIAEPARPAQENKLPAEAEQALRAPGKVTLYSLEPYPPPVPRDKTLHGRKVLGQTELDGERRATAIAEFKSAVSHWDGMIALCFNPRHAIRVTANGHTYDFLLCYECHQLYIYRDDKLLKELGAAGSPKVLNELLSTAKVPLSESIGKIEDPDNFNIWLPEPPREKQESAKSAEAPKGRRQRL